MSLETIVNLDELQYWYMINYVNNKTIILLGAILVGAFLLYSLTRKLKIPSVVGYILVGILFSVSSLDSLPFVSAEFKEWYSFLINSFGFVPALAVSFISFEIGTSLAIRILKRLEIEFALVVLLESFGAFLLVSVGMYFMGIPFYIAILLGAIASATAPAATVMVLNEYGGKGELSATLMVVLALDEVLALVIFSFIEPISLIGLSPGQELTLFNSLLTPLARIIGAVVIGLLVGYLSQWLMSKHHNKNMKVLLILATVFGTTALAISLHLSYLIANLAVGFAYRNFARKRLEIADQIHTMTIPLFAVYFIMAGTKIQLTNLTSSGFLLIAIVYALTRIIGKYGGASLGARLSGAPRKVQKYIGLGLLPQIGVAIDLAYIVQHDFVHIDAGVSDLAILVINIILFTTLITEIIGPLATEYGLNRAGEIKT